MVGNSQQLEGMLLLTLSVCMWEYWQCRKIMHKFEGAFWTERRGRARVENAMKKLSDVQLNTEEGFFVQPIGEIHSCYRQCIGTPRQGLLVPASRSSLHLNTHISPESLDGLDAFSHVWITFKFHLNSNILRESGKKTFNAKITLPMLKQKMGVFATRSPHRPNPVGITMAKIDSVDKRTRTVYLSACDLVEGTPVLDIKPYVPAYDTVAECRIADWIADTVYTRNNVSIQPHCIEYVHKIQHRLVQYKNDADAFIRGIIETLEAEVRSKFQTSKRMNESTQGDCVLVPFDETVVSYEWRSEREFEIVDIVLKRLSKTLFAQDSSKIADIVNES